MRTEGLESARFASFADLIALQYGLCVIFMLLKMFVMAGSAPWILSVGLPSFLTAFGVLRGLQWMRLPEKHLPEDMAAAMMRKSSKLVLVAACVFLINDTALYIYSSGSQRLFMLVVMLMACVCQLFYFMYMPRTAALAAGLHAVMVLGLAAWSGDGIIIATTLLALSVIAILSHAVYRHHNEFIALIATHKELRRLGDENERLASTDALTGLPNRREFFKDLIQVEKKAAADGKCFALGMIDLDGFKTVNDTWGHRVGDDVLTIVAARLRHITGSIARPYRLAGDEFAFIVEATSQPEFVKLLGESIIASISQRMSCKGVMVKIGCSIGVAVYPSSADDTSRLYEAADEALYTSKNRGRGCVTIHVPADAHPATHRAMA